MRSALILLYLLVPFSISVAHPLLNLNTEERTVYENLEASEGAVFHPVTIRPYSYERAFYLADLPERISLYMNALSPPGYFLKPLNSLTLNLYYTSEEAKALENRGGTVLRRGLNLRALADGYLSLGGGGVLYYQLLYSRSSRDSRVDLYRAYLKLRLWKLSLQAGKDTVHLGPGEYALLLSSHAEPFPLLKVQTERSLKLLGGWDFVFVRGWLRERRRDRSDPNILAIRVVWKPVNFLEIGATRTALYGGEGRPAYRLLDYPKMIIGTEDNVPYSRYDVESYGAVDFTLYLPLHRIVKGVRTFKVYYQEGGTDIIAWWQKEDRGEFYPPFGFKLLSIGYVAGALLSTERSIVRLEFTKIDDEWYIHPLYSVEGYAYRGLSLGHPYGRDLVQLNLSHRYYISRRSSLFYRVGAYRQPAANGERSVSRYYFLISGERRLKTFILQGFLRLDRSEGYDTDPLPHSFAVTEGERSFVTLGVSFSWRL